ncbi:MAG: MASE1 domain-containing protein [Betaproteobacteria bacterium]
MRQVIVIFLVAAAYIGLAGLSAALAYSSLDAWSVWLASGLTLGLLLARPRTSWPAILGGAFAGAAIFATLIGSAPDALGYGAIEVVTAFTGAWIVARMTSLPIRLERPRELAALVFGGALPQALLGALVAAVWNVAAAGGAGTATFRFWALSNLIGTLLVAPLVLAWAQFRAKRSGGLAMPAFVGGGIACALFLVSVYLLFRAGPQHQLGGNVGRGLIYVPIVFMAVLALLWGLRGATLAAAAAALIALCYTKLGSGPFAGIQGYLGDPELEVQAYAAAVALTGILVAVLAASQRLAMRIARDWKTRFEAAIGAHRLVAYEWDPASGRMVVTGDTAQLLGVASTQIAMLADWLTLPVAEDRERVAARFEQRALSASVQDTLAFQIRGPGGPALAVTDEARAIFDHDGALHRIVGIVRVAPAGNAR